VLQSWNGDKTSSKRDREREMGSKDQIKGGEKQVREEPWIQKELVVAA